MMVVVAEFFFFFILTKTEVISQFQWWNRPYKVHVGIVMRGSEIVRVESPIVQHIMLDENFIYFSFQLEVNDFRICWMWWLDFFFVCIDQMLWKM